MFRNIKMFSKVFRNIMTCLVDCPVVRMFQNFQFIPKHAYLFRQHFKNVLENFQDCSETFRYVFGIFQKCSGTLRCFQKSSEIFRLISRLSCFHNVSKLLVYSAILRFFWKYILKLLFCFGNISKSVPEHSDVPKKRCSWNILTWLVDYFVFRVFWNFQYYFDIFRFV